MKKIISIILSLILVFSIIPFSVYADGNGGSGEIDISDYTDSELDLSQYTLEDLTNMSAEEYTALVREFERVYDPYDSYVEEEEPGGETINPRWTSGDINIFNEYTNAGCHEYITQVACGILANDKGFYTNDPLEVVVFILSLSLSSLLPDKDERGLAFEGHFYDPDTGENYLGSSTNTARTNAQAHYFNAVLAAQRGDMDEAYEELGRCLHYVQDANEPHHAANNRNIIDGYSHSQFENFAFEEAETHLSSYTSISNSYYTQALNSSNTVDEITHSAAVTAKSFINYVNDTGNQTQWDYAAEKCLKRAARYSAMIMYKFSQVDAVPFYSN